MRVAIVMTPAEMAAYIESLPEPYRTEYQTAWQDKKAHPAFFHHQLDIPIYIVPA